MNLNRSSILSYECGIEGVRTDLVFAFIVRFDETAPFLLLGPEPNTGAIPLPTVVPLVAIQHPKDAVHPLGLSSARTCNISAVSSSGSTFRTSVLEIPFARGMEGGDTPLNIK